jgi:hypothetical protein
MIQNPLNLSANTLKTVNNELCKQGYCNPTIEEITTDNYRLNHDAVLHLYAYQKTLKSIEEPLHPAVWVVLGLLVGKIL